MQLRCAATYPNTMFTEGKAYKVVETNGREPNHSCALFTVIDNLGHQRCIGRHGDKGLCFIVRNTGIVPNHAFFELEVTA